MKRLLSVVLSTVILLSVLPTPFAAHALDASGTCGENVTYTFNSTTGELTIQGTGDMRFSGESPFYNNNAIKSVFIGKGVTSIADKAFYGCKHISEVNISSTVTAIKSYAFYECSSLKRIIIPSRVSKIEMFAFSATGITSIGIPDNVTEIGHSAFSRCTSLLYASFTDGLLSKIPTSLFFGCTELRGLWISKSITSIGQNAFWGCGKLTEITVDSGNKTYDSRNNCNAIIETSTNTLIRGCKNTIIPNGVKILGESAFHASKGLRSIDIPDSVTTIEKSAFSACSNLSSVSLPSSVTAIGDSAFSSCSSLKFIELPKNLKVVSKSMFSFCDNLTSVAIPKSVTSIKNGAFGSFKTYYSDKLNEVFYFGSQEDWDKINIESDNTLINVAIKHYNYSDETIYGDNGKTLWAYSSESTDTEFIVPNKVTEIADGAFCNKSISKITISENVEKIGEESFSACPKLDTVEFEDECKLESIEAGAFKSTDVEALYLPDNVKTIKSEAFAKCSRLKTVRMPESLEVIDNDVLDENNNVVVVCVYGSNAQKYAQLRAYDYFAMSRIPSQVYLGKQVKPTVTVYSKQRKLKYGQDYTVDYGANNKVGVKAGAVYAYGVNEYSGSAESQLFDIVRPLKASTLKISLNKTQYSYDGKVKKPSYKVKTSSGKLVTASNYSVSYQKGRKKVGTYTVTFKFKGNYTGTVKKTFKIVPKSTSVSKVTAKSKGFTVKWKKQTAQVTGYQIQYSTSAKFKNAKTLTVKNNKTVAKTVGKLKANKKYYVRIRTYKTVNKKNYYSAWSKAKAVKTKK